MRRPPLVLGALFLCAAQLSLPGSATASAGPASIKVTPAGASVVKKAIAAERGHVVVVDFWATWCDPCMAEFPYLVKLQKDYGNRGLVVIAVSQDMKRDVQSKVVPFLKKKHADFPEYLERADDPGEFINAFDPHWEGDLPRTFIYDKHGRLVKELPEQPNEYGFVKVVKPLLRKR